jgi:arabinofuranan 3-O-arabinosyltransferase
MTDRGYRLLVLGWSLFAAWVLIRYGYRLGLLFYAELGLDMDTNIVDRDFANYWVGGRLVLEGNYPMLFDQPVYYAHLKEVFGSNYQVHAWSYPPHFLGLVAPLGFLEYRPALAVFLVATLALFAFSAREFIKEYAPDTSRGLVALALAGFVFMQIEATQNGFLTAALLLATLACMREKPVLAGFFLAVLTVKPQLGFLIPLLALLDRNWKLLGWASGFTVALIAVSVAIFGVDVWRAYFEHTLPYQNYVMKNWAGIFLEMMPSTFGSLRALEHPYSTAIQVQAVVSVISLAILVGLLIRLRDPLERVFAILAGTFLISPYAFNYDMGAVSVAAACLALRAGEARRQGAMAIYGLLAVLPAFLQQAGDSRLPIAPLVLAAAFAVLWTGARRSAIVAR